MQKRQTAEQDVISRQTRSHLEEGENGIMPITINFTSQSPVINEIPSTERGIYQKTAIFSAEPESTNLNVHFPENLRITEGYIFQIASTLRILYMNTGQVIRFIESDNPIMNANLGVLNHLTCAFKPEDYVIRLAPMQDLTDFFSNYNSTISQYSYINNGIPWLLLLNQTKISLIQLRIEFTLIDMFGRLYTTSTRNNEIFKAFFDFHFQNGNDAMLQEFYDNEIVPRFNQNEVHAHPHLRGNFNSIQNVINAIMANGQQFPTMTQQLPGVVYRLRCRYFHGNMTATHPVDGANGGFIVALENLCYKMIVVTICKLFDSVAANGQ